jgi:hypothetical protein
MAYQSTAGVAPAISILLNGGHDQPQHSDTGCHQKALLDPRVKGVQRTLCQVRCKNGACQTDTAFSWTKNLSTRMTPMRQTTRIFTFFAKFAALRHSR